MRRLPARLLPWIAIAFTLSMLIPTPALALAQDAPVNLNCPEGYVAGATPVAAAVPSTGETVKSITREEFQAQLVEDQGYTEAATPGGTFIDSVTSDIQTVHPFLAEESASLTVVGLIYDTLVGGDVRTGQIVPTGLADFWEIAPDNHTYTFHLNKNAKWHDGQDVTAQDAQFSFDAIANPESGSVYTGSFVDTVESWRAIDDDTFEVVAKEPRYTFLFDIQTAWILPKHIWEAVPFAEWRTDPGATGTDPSRVVGSGPFKFQEWRQGESVTLERNDDYYGKVPYIDSYVMRIWPDQTAVVNALLNGEIDAAGLEPSDIAAVEGQPGIQVAHYPTRGFSYYEFNLNPNVTMRWHDEKLRQALLYALDRESIVNDILLGYAEVAQGTQPKVSYAYAPDQIETKYTYDPEKARALLAEAGYSDSDGDGILEKDGQPLSFELLYASGSPTSEQIVAYLQDAWKAVGVDMAPHALEFPALIEATTTSLDWDVAMYGFSWDASFIQDAMFGSNQYQVGFNDMMYCNPQVDELNAQAKLTFDEAARRDLLIDVSNIVNDEQPIAVLFFSEGHAAYSDRLQNYKPSTWGVDLTYVWIQQ